jgi:hypothetical protein
MRYFFGVFSIAGILGFLMAAYNNFSPVDLSPEGLKEKFQDLKQDIQQEHKQYVRIGKKYYERNERGVYYIDGIPTFVKKGQPIPTSQAVPRNPSLGAPIDPKIYKEAMGIGADDEFFKPRKSEDEE